MFSLILTKISRPAHSGPVDLYRHQHFFKPFYKSNVDLQMHFTGEDHLLVE